MEASFPFSRPPKGTASDGMMSVPKFFNIVDLGGGELGLPGYPKALPLPASWRQVAGGALLMCSWVATVVRLLKEVLATVGQDVLQQAQVSPEMETRGFLPVFS
jgi:hypothetical protein